MSERIERSGATRALATSFAVAVMMGSGCQLAGGVPAGVGSGTQASCVSPAPPTSMPDALFGFAAAALGEQIYLAGGFTRDGSPTGTLFLAYDVPTGTWSDRAPTPFPFTGQASLASDGKNLYIANLAQGAVYDPATDAWRLTAPLTRARHNHTLVTGADGKIYSFGGVDDVIGTVDWADVYDPATDHWTALPAMPFHADVFVAGVWPGTHELFVASDVAGAYDPATQTWRTFDRVRPKYWAAGASDGARVYALGGMYGSSPPNHDVEAFDFATATWQALPALDQPLMQSAAAMGCDGRVYLFGGNSGSMGTVATVRVFDPSANTWTVSP